MIDWIDEAGKVWGVAKRRIVLGGYWYANEGFHQDGFSARSVVAKLLEERDGAAQNKASQSTPEVFTGEALVFEIAIDRISERWFYLAHYRYVIPNRLMPAKSKMMALRDLFPKHFKDERAYYNELHSLHCFLMGKMPEVPRVSDSAQETRKHCAEDTCNFQPVIRLVSS